VGASSRYENVDSLDMSWLSLPRFESQAVGVAVCGLGARGRVPHPISVRSSAAEGALGMQPGVLHLAIIARRCRYAVFPP
jgi:hypothetical protein